MSQSQQTNPNRFMQVIVFGLCYWLYEQTAPSFLGGQVQWLPMFFLLTMIALGLSLLSHSLMMLAYVMEWLAVHQSTGAHGTARWADNKHIKGELERKKQGAFWGLTTAKRPKSLFIEYVSNAMTIAPAGSGKGIFAVVPMGLSILASKVFVDFKGELICILKTALEGKGQVVHCLNPFGLWSDVVGEGDSLNPLDMIADDLNRVDGLRDVPDDLRELTTLLLPEPDGGKSDDSYWREGSRRIIADVTLLEVMVEGYEATLASVALLIEDKNALEHNLRWIVGVNRDGSPLENGAMPIEQSEWAHYHNQQDMNEFVALVRARASNLLTLMCGESKTFDSFISGAQQALAPFAFGRLAPAMCRSTFNINVLKDEGEIHNLFIVIDNSRMETSKRYIEINQWLIMTSIKRHQNKKKPVYFILDEVTNYKMHGLESLLTWGRSYGVRLHLIFQDLSAFEKTYGKTALETLLSETEIKQFLAGQRSPKTLELISKQLLGNASIMNASVSLKDKESGAQSQMGEKARPLLTPDEIRRMTYGILLVRDCLPLLIEPVSYAQVKPWCKQVGINPFHGKPFKQKIKLRL